MSIAARIRKARIEAGFSQSHLAELMRVTRSACSQWEQPGGTAPRGSRLERLATVLGVSVEWIATGHGDAREPHTADARAGYRNALSGDERELLDRFAQLDREGQKSLLGLLRRVKPTRR